MENLEQKSDKINRVLSMFDLLTNGKTIRKSDMVRKFGVNEKSIQRDLYDIRCYLAERTNESGKRTELLYDRKKGVYQFVDDENVNFTKEEILAMAKILLDSRAFTKKEMMRMLDKLIKNCALPEQQKLLADMIANEKYYYIEPHHHKVFMDKLWNIGVAIHEEHYLLIDYARTKDKSVVRRKIIPQAIMFSEFYFYLVGQIENIDREKEFDLEDDIYPTIYRIDRIRDLKVMKEKFKIPYSQRFQEGEYRKRIQFMYGGKLQHILFWYKGYSVEAVLDRLPTAKIVKEEKGRFLIKAETFGNGIDMWLRSQGDNIEVVKR